MSFGFTDPGDSDTADAGIVAAGFVESDGNGRVIFTAHDGL